MSADQGDAVLKKRGMRREIAMQTYVDANKMK
jgi:hypothetical protein